MVDFGLFILIWMVQLIVYPSFEYIQADTFRSWHKRYTFNISLLVIPLMFGQVLFIGAQVFQTPNWAVYTSVVLVLLAWISTFTQAVPLHNAISANQQQPNTLSLLVARNWVRTLLWTIVFCLGWIRT